MTGGNIPPGAFPAGQTENGEALYIGRVNHDGALTPGKVSSDVDTTVNSIRQIMYEIKENFNKFLGAS